MHTLIFAIVYYRWEKIFKIFFKGIFLTRAIAARQQTFHNRFDRLMIEAKMLIASNQNKNNFIKTTTKKCTSIH